jgi:hypothetical protein
MGLSLEETPKRFARGRVDLHHRPEMIRDGHASAIAVAAAGFGVAAVAAGAQTVSVSAYQA